MRPAREGPRGLRRWDRAREDTAGGRKSRRPAVLASAGSAMPALLLHLLFFASGAAGLIYEVVWVRQFATVFGSSVYSVAIVTALFMCGLGVGGFAAGRFADARF